jgi:hypothetical protein
LLLDGNRAQDNLQRVGVGRGSEYVVGRLGLVEREPVRRKRGRVELATLDQLQELRRLLLSREQRELSELRERLADKQLRAREVAGVLPQAVKLSGAHGEELSRALQPALEGSICPWARSDTPGYPNGGNKFDLSKWDEAYFKRLKDFMEQAGKRGIVVELNLFTPFYEENIWALSPQKASNNINGVGDVARTNVYTLDRNGGLLAVHDAMVRKLVNELKDFDNLYYEICNEPYFGGVTMDWQRHVADTIVETEKPFPHHHLISQNIANGQSKIENPHPAVSIFNFHYATPPETVGLNYGLGKVIGDNETGFRGTNDSQYRMEAWDFVVAGGGLFNNLDYSFTAGHEDGTFVYPKTQPGGGSTALRRQYAYLKQLIQQFDFVHMQPARDLVKVELPHGASARALIRTGKDYLVYIRTGLGDWKDSKNKTKFGPGELAFQLELPAGKFVAEVIAPLNRASGVRT